MREIEALKREEEEAHYGPPRRYHGRGHTRSSSDEPHERHWKRSRPVEKTDHDD